MRDTNDQSTDNEVPTSGALSIYTPPTAYAYAGIGPTRR